MAIIYKKGDKMAGIWDRLNDEVLLDLKKCKKGKLAGQNWTICKDLTCRTFYFEPNKYTIRIWQEEGLYKKEIEIDSRVIFVCERPGPNNPVKEEDSTVRRCWGEENANRRSVWRLRRFLKVRKDYGLQDCYITNIVKCSKFSGTDSPSVDEIKECSKHLIKEIEIIQPEVVVAVGGGQDNILRRKPFKALIGDKLHKITHYAFRGSEEELWESWDREFKELKRKISSSPIM